MYIYIYIYNRGLIFGSMGSKTANLPNRTGRKKFDFCGLGFGCTSHMLRKASAAGLGRHLETVLGSLLGLLTQAGEVVQKDIEQQCSRCQNVVLANINNMQNAKDTIEKLKICWMDTSMSKLFKK